MRAKVRTKVHTKQKMSLSIHLWVYFEQMKIKPIHCEALCDQFQAKTCLICFRFVLHELEKAIERWERDERERKRE